MTCQKYKKEEKAVDNEPEKLETSEFLKGKIITIGQTLSRCVQSK